MHSIIEITKKHFLNEQRSRDAAAKKRANTSGVGKSNNFGEWMESMGVASGHG